MPRFYFDFVDNNLTVDDVGTDFENAQQACDEAVRTLPNVAQDTIAEGQSRDVLVLVRNEDGQAIFTASLTLAAKWVVANI